MDSKAYSQYVRNLKVRSLNQKVIGHEFNKMFMNQAIMRGNPILFEEEKPRIEQEREETMTLLKTITTQPNKFYTYLYNTGQLETFSVGMHEFARKYLKYKKNIPYNSLVQLWSAYKSGKSNNEVPSNLDEIVNIGHVRERERQNILKEEEKRRENIKSAEYQAFRRKKEKIEKVLKELRQEIIKRTNDMIKEQDFKRQEIIQKEIDELNKQWRNYRIKLNKLSEDLPQEKFDKFEEWEETHAIPFKEEIESGSGLRKHKKSKIIRVNNLRRSNPIHIGIR